MGTDEYGWVRMGTDEYGEKFIFYIDICKKRGMFI